MFYNVRITIKISLGEKWTHELRVYCIAYLRIVARTNCDNQYSAYMGLLQCIKNAHSRYVRKSSNKQLEASTIKFRI